MELIYPFAKAQSPFNKNYAQGSPFRLPFSVKTLYLQLQGSS